MENKKYHRKGELMKSNSIIGVGLFFVAISTASVFADNYTDFPPIDPRFKEIYEELMQEEADLFEKLKQSFRNIPENAWPKSFAMPDTIFARIKKNYSGTPECDGLPKQYKKKLTRNEFDNLINKYAACAAERNGFDPKKVEILFDRNDQISDARAQMMFLDNSSPWACSFFIDKDFEYSLLGGSNSELTLLKWKNLIDLYSVRMRFYYYRYCSTGISNLHNTYKNEFSIQALDELILRNTFAVMAMQDEHHLTFLLNDKNILGNKNEPSIKKLLDYLARIKAIHNASAKK